MFFVRPAGSDDIAGLVALDSFAAQSAERVQAIAEWVGAGWCFCAEKDGRLAGYGVVHPHFFGQNFLEMLMVDARFRRQGAGRALLRHAIERCEGAYLWTSTNRTNRPMQTLLADFGFMQKGFIEGLDEGDPELVFRGGGLKSETS